MSIKDKFPDEESLIQHIRSHSFEYFTTIFERLANHESEYWESLSKNFANKKLGAIYIAKGFAPLLGLYLFLLIIQIGLNQYLVFVIGFAVAIHVVIGIVQIRKGISLLNSDPTVSDKFDAEVNELLFPLVFSIFDIKATYIPHSAHNLEDDKDHPFWNRDIFPGPMKRSRKTSNEHRQVFSLFTHSNLISKLTSRIEVDDMVGATIFGRTFFLSELRAFEMGDRAERQNFKGYFVAFDLPRSLQGKTLIATKGDDDLLKDQSFLNFLQGFPDRSPLDFFRRGKLKPVKLEWNNFHDLLQVLATDPVEARYVLTPNFMTDLYDWWLTKKINIRVSFRANRMYVIFPAGDIKFDSTLNEITQSSLESYLQTIALPLLHVLHLIEDVDTNMR